MTSSLGLTYANLVTTAIEGLKSGASDLIIGGGLSLASDYVFATKLTNGQTLDWHHRGYFNDPDVTALHFVQALSTLDGGCLIGATLELSSSPARHTALVRLSQSGAPQ